MVISAADLQYGVSRQRVDSNLGFVSFFVVTVSYRVSEGSLVTAVQLTLKKILLQIQLPLETLLKNSYSGGPL